MIWSAISSGLRGPEKRLPHLATKISFGVSRVCGVWNVPDSMKNKVLVLILAFISAINLYGQTQKRTFALQSESAEFWKVVDRDAKLETVGTGFGFTEGPI